MHRIFLMYYDGSSTGWEVREPDWRSGLGILHRLAGRPASIFTSINSLLHFLWLLYESGHLSRLSTLHAIISLLVPFSSCIKSISS